MAVVEIGLAAGSAQFSAKFLVLLFSQEEPGYDKYAVYGLSHNSYQSGLI